MAKEFPVGSRGGTFSAVGYYTFCDNSGAVVNAKEPRSHKKRKHIERKYHLIHEIVSRGDTVVSQIASDRKSVV